ncbi:putative membrane protein SirB2 [Sinobacterium caligoides]|uniref:Putative membrane protein SirB2 n=1 Tax=Sinobacterium caligoides TaxID=933926 RepID=A0A3N2E0M9_9GAMM|nr:SirB2 family protein [Sinobacterium caligoides]ROS05189.1 putative membrane protein SirB2 [Sinobacterium caligoides]
MYAMLKHLHMTLALLSIIGFILRGVLLATGSGLMQKKLLKIAPHIIDTILLITAIGLMVTINSYPFYNASWLSAKLIALIGYIGFGIIAFKAGRPIATRVVTFFAALGCVGYILAVAITKNPTLGL